MRPEPQPKPLIFNAHCYPDPVPAITPTTALGGAPQRLEPNWTSVVHWKSTGFYMNNAVGRGKKAVLQMTCWTPPPPGATNKTQTHPHLHKHV